ncbi:40S ribosomal protein S22-B [Cucumispora dikerogammari]|nr:40S ribosomal protein S22-B [Cucumispora dikerogammari]
MDHLSAALTQITNASKAHKRIVLIKRSTGILRDFLLSMQAEGYISDIRFIDDNKCGKILIHLNGRLTRASAIRPRYNLENSEIERYRENVLPARQFGHLMLTTDQGVIDHRSAIKKKIGGRIIGYFY